MQAARGASLNSSDQVTFPPDSPIRRSRLRLTFLLVTAAGLAADQGSKAWAEAELEGRGRVAVLGDWFGVRLTHNPGAAFSTGTGYTWVFTLVAIVAVVVVVVLARRLGSTWWAFGLGFLLAGILGNLTDRLFRDPEPFRGHVVDFLELPNWPIFNVADICINVAAGVIILQAIRGVGIDGRRHGPDQAEPAEDAS